MKMALGDVFPAAVLHVFWRGETIFQRAYGWLDPETKTQATQPDTFFDIASLTKLFTATVFMILVDEKKVTLDTAVTAIIPEFSGTRAIIGAEDPLKKIPIPPNVEFDGQKVNADTVTFRHLLTHTSGLAAWRSLYQESPDAPPIPQPIVVSPQTRAARIAAIWQKYGFIYPPGKKMVYSDLGFILLGEAITRLLAMPLDTAIQQKLLRPLNLHATFKPLSNGFKAQNIAPTEFCAWRERRCIGEVDDENAAGLGGVAGHAGLFASAKDVSALGQLFLNDGSAFGAQILSAHNVAEMTRTQVNLAGQPRGLGWQLPPRENSPCGTRFSPGSFGHTGFTGTSLWVDPHHKLVVSLLTNRVYYGRNATQIAAFRPKLHNTLIEILEKT